MMKTGRASSAAIVKSRRSVVDLFFLARSVAILCLARLVQGRGIARLACHVGDLLRRDGPVGIAHRCAARGKVYRGLRHTRCGVQHAFNPPHAGSTAHARDIQHDVGLSGRVTRFVQRLGECCDRDRSVMAHLRRLGGQIHFGPENARHGGQRLFDPPDTGSTGHPVYSKRERIRICHGCFPREPVCIDQTDRGSSDWRVKCVREKCHLSVGSAEAPDRPKAAKYRQIRPVSGQPRHGRARAHAHACAHVHDPRFHPCHPDRARRSHRSGRNRPRSWNARSRNRWRAAP